MSTVPARSTSAHGTRVAFCVAGWHFGLPFYEAVCDLINVDVYVVSHRRRNAVPRKVAAMIGPDRLFIEPNLGYDWGCYQQFLNRNLWRDYEMTIFIHDDVTILDSRLVERCAELLDEGHGVIGNGRTNARAAWPSRYPQSYAHAAFLPPRDFVHDLVRGSFFAASREALSVIGAFEVFWDPFGLGIQYGNFSLRATCARWEACLGPRCFSHLSNEYLKSPFLLEHVRGDLDVTTLPRTRWGGKYRPKSLAQYALRWLLAYYTECRWLSWRSERRLAERALRPLVRVLSGVTPRAGSAPKESGSRRCE